MSGKMSMFFVTLLLEKKMVDGEDRVLAEHGDL